MTLPRADRDLLMCCASLSVKPADSDLATFSEPARSTSVSFDVRFSPEAYSGARTRACAVCTRQSQNIRKKQRRIHLI